MTEDMEIPPFPEVWSATMRSAFVMCPRLGFYSYIRGLRKYGERSVHVHFGACIARGLETTRMAYWRDGKDEMASITAGATALIKEWGDYEIPAALENKRAGVKTLAACIDALVSYFEQHQLGNDTIRPLIVSGEPLVEITFTLPVPGTRHPTTGNPILYTGRFDMLGVYQDGPYEGAVFPVDEKSTLQLGDAWRSNWPLRGQLTGYCWGAQEFLPSELSIAGCIVRGIGIAKQDIHFAESILSRPQWQIDQWLRQLRFDIEHAANIHQIMCSMYKEEQHLAWDQNLDAACSTYGGCSYISLCDTPDPRVWYDEYIEKHLTPAEIILHDS